METMTTNAQQIRDRTAELLAIAEDTVTMQQLVDQVPGLTLRQLRYYLDRAEPFYATIGGTRRVTKPGNGLAAAIVRRGNRRLVRRSLFLEWFIHGHIEQAAS